MPDEARLTGGAIFAFLLLILATLAVLATRSTERTAADEPPLTPTIANYLPVVMKPWPTESVSCGSYFSAVNPAVLVPDQVEDYASAVGIRSLILMRDDACALSVFEQKEPTVYVDGQQMLSSAQTVSQLKDHNAVVVDLDASESSEGETLSLSVKDKHGRVLLWRNVANIAETGVFQVPIFLSTEDGTTNPQILDSREIRPYHVDTIPLPGDQVTTSFDIGVTYDVRDQCGKPDGILDPQIFIHWNAVDYGKCESGPGSTVYEVIYPGPYPARVRELEDFGGLGTCVQIELLLNEISEPPVFAVQEQGGSFDYYYLLTRYCHLSQVMVEAGYSILPGTTVGSIGELTYNTELHEERHLVPVNGGSLLSPGDPRAIPYKTTLSRAQGDWIETLINTYNAAY